MMLDQTVVQVGQCQCMLPPLRGATAPPWIASTTTSPYSFIFQSSWFPISICQIYLHPLQLHPILLFLKVLDFLFQFVKYFCTKHYFTLFSYFSKFLTYYFSLSSIFALSSYSTIMISIASRTESEVAILLAKTKTPLVIKTYSQ